MGPDVELFMIHLCRLLNQFVNCLQLVQTGPRGLPELRQYIPVAYYIT